MNQERNTRLAFLYKKYYDAVQRHCLPLVEYHPAYYPLIEDCVQDAFLQAVEEYDKYKDYKNPIGWIICVAQNKVKSQYRDELRHNNAIPLFHHAESVDMAFSIETVDTSSIRQERIEMIANIYQSLSEREKKVFIAYFLNDMNHKETSVATNEPLSDEYANMLAI